jgi:hypothetical protein
LYVTKGKCWGDRSAALAALRLLTPSINSWDVIGDKAKSHSPTPSKWKYLQKTMPWKRKYRLGRFYMYCANCTGKMTSDMHFVRLGLELRASH